VLDSCCSFVGCSKIFAKLAGGRSVKVDFPLEIIARFCVILIYQHTFGGDSS